MPQFVRADLRINRWLETEGRPPQDFPADVITDLKTKGDQLSVFEVTEAITAERIAIAISAAREVPTTLPMRCLTERLLRGWGFLSTRTTAAPMT